MTLQRDRLPDDSGVATVPALPEAVAQHGHAGTPAPVVASRDRSADGGTHAECGEEITAHRVAEHAKRFTARGEIELRIAHGEHTGEHVLPVADLLPQRIGEDGAALLPSRHHDQ